MPQRSSELEVVKPTSLRRSPRFLHFEDSPKTPKPNSRKPISLSSHSSPRNPKNGSTNSGKSSKGLKKSHNGSKNCEESANGLARTTRLSGYVEGIEGLRRSPRFRNEVDSLLVFDKPLNKKVDRSVDCNSKSKKGSKKELISVGKDNVAMLDFVDFPVTPNGVGEKKFRGFSGKDNEIETSDSCGEILVNSERRITRSCSKLVDRKVEVGKISQSKQNGSSLCKHQTRESKRRIVLCALQSSGVRLDGEVRGRSCSKGKKNRIDSCKSLTNVSKTVSSVSVSRCIRREGRRGRRNNLADDHEEDGKTDNSCRQVDGNLDRTITRSGSKQMGGESDLHCQSMERRSTRVSSKHAFGKAESVKERKERQEGSASSKSLGTESQKRMLRSSMSSAYAMKREEKATLDIEGKEKEPLDCAEVDIPGRGENKKKDFTRDTKLTGVKRKRKQVGLQGSYQGWTKEQEVALQKAYFSEKPSPHFWKKVSKLVPGKSAQECFDKVHSDNQTPQCTKSFSRAKKQNPASDFLVSGSVLPKFIETKSKKSCKSKHKSQVARKTVRQLLQKYCHVNPDNEADMFAVLEPSVNPSAETLQPNDVQLTPKCLLRSLDLSSKSHDRSSSGYKKCLSRFSDRSESPLTSPPVLKKVKNMALHEKYIDQLHIRERKRKVAFSRCIKSAQNQKDGEENSVRMPNIIKAAKDALVSDAKDAINEFRYSQANILEAFSDSEEILNSDNDEDETVL